MLASDGPQKEDLRQRCGSLPVLLAASESCALLDVTLREILLFTQGAQAVADNHRSGLMLKLCRIRRVREDTSDRVGLQKADPQRLELTMLL
jgi:hypothetical protein